MAAWPGDRPLLFFRMGPRFSVMALAAAECPPAAIGQKLLVQAPAPDRRGAQCPDLPFFTGFMGILPYGSPQECGDFTPRIFAVSAALVWDHETGVTYLTHQQGAGEFAGGLAPWFRPWETGLPPAGPPMTLESQGSDQDYLATVAAVQEDIRAGRFYQLNLLRYFRLHGLHRGQQLLERFATHAGPFGSWLRLCDGLEVISLSPERFVQGSLDGGNFRVITQPIKGTAPRFSDSALDQEAAQGLLASPKDRAELAMITDLMRNDLFRVCRSGSVRVERPFELQSFANVHHLVSTVSGWVQPQMTWQTFWERLCPGGSITGAPKVEVMKAIRTYEGRDRGYFMGNFFAWDPGRGHLDSSILIRTVVKRPGGQYEFAAGSGIILGSEPEQEQAEIAAKSRVITN